MSRTVLYTLLVLLCTCRQPTRQEGHGHETATTEHDPKNLVWTYEGDRGPSTWATIHREYQPCGDGKHQSPINIKAPGVNSSHTFDFGYNSSSEVILNNGHTIELLYDSGSIFSFDGTDYNLLQFHFHTPAEHLINGERFPIEMHLVHRSLDTTYLVLGILFEEGNENTFLSRIILDAPEKVETKAFDTRINVTELIPDTSEFYYYSGSFTTPPCKEAVRWLIFKAHDTASPLQIKALRALEGSNSRPVQDLNGRVVEEISS